MSLQKLLGTEKLQSKNGAVDTASIEGKTLLIYFSAHWCPPCRGFTPKLAQFYKEQKAKRDDFEILFVSGDRSEAEFDSYYAESHPWLTVPWSAGSVRAKLNKVFKVEGIPSLVVVDKDGTLVTKKGTEMVQRDPQGSTFPWLPKGMYEILAEAKMTTKAGQTLTVADLKKTDNFALYFSAHWCPPCRAFTPSLVSTYKTIKAAGKNTEFIFVSSDKKEDEYNEYYAEMPWATLAFGDKTVQDLKGLCEVQGIPTLVTCKGADGTVINAGAVGAAREDTEGNEYPWEKKPLAPCSPFSGGNEDVIEAINGSICVVLSTNDAANKETAKVEFTKAADKFHADMTAKGEEPDVFFFIVDTAPAKDLYGRVLQALKMAEPKAGEATVLGFNLSNNLAKDAMSGEVSMQSVLDHAAAFKKAQ